MKFKSDIIRSNYFITFYILLGIVIISMLFLWYSQQLINRIKENEYRYIELFSNISAMAPKISNKQLNILFENVQKGINFPVIITDENQIPITSRNIELPEDPEKKLKKLINMTLEMDKINPPIKIDIETPQFHLVQYLHYGQSGLIIKLQWYSFILLFIITIFIGFGIYLFFTMKRYEQSYLWIGLAKETAHQLGTPVSSLMGWTELIKEYSDSQEIYNVTNQMSVDIQRLKQISDRFNRIGNTPSSQPIDINQLVIEICQYFRERLPNFSKNITIIEKTSPELPRISGNKILLQWALENIIKNAIDSITSKKGLIVVSTEFWENKVLIFIKDNGKGLPKSSFFKIFQPGYSTKKIGWGLGLTLVRRIIGDYHNGKVFVKESGPEKGTTMGILLNPHKSEKNG